MKIAGFVDIIKRMKKYRSSLKVISGIFLLAIVLVLGAWFVLGGMEDSWICENGVWVKHGNSQKPKPVSDCGEEPGGRANYVNQELGFSLEIPQSWQGWYEVNVLSLDPKAGAKTGAIMSASFDFLAQESEIQNQTLFSVNKVSLATWQEFQKEPLFKGRKLAETPEAIFYAEQSLDNPFVGGEGDNYQSMTADISPILATFSLFK